MTTQNLIAPNAAPGMTFFGESGAKYVSGAGGVLLNVLAGDVAPLLSAGCSPAVSSTPLHGDVTGTSSNDTVVDIGGATPASLFDPAGAANLAVLSQRKGGLAVQIQGLGDSFMTQAFCQPNVLPNSSTSPNPVPAWTPNTVYTLNNVVSNNGYIYLCTTAGTSASSGGPSTVGFGIADGTAAWQIRYPAVQKWNTNILAWMERLSNGALRWDMSDGYQGTVLGMIKVIVTNGGSGYSGATTLAITAGVSANHGVVLAPVIVNGVITAVTVKNPGSFQGFATIVATDPGGGSGATFSPVAQGGGSFGCSGCYTADAVARLPDAVQSAAQLMVVYCGVNDIAAATNAQIMSGAAFASITANLRTMWETLFNAGKDVLVFTFYPEVRFTGLQTSLMVRLNKWIRAYAARRAWTTGGGSFAGVPIFLADVEGFGTNGASGTDQPIATNTYDGTHMSPRFAWQMAWTGITALQSLLAPAYLYARREYTGFNDGYDPVLNPGGNLLEGIPWQASTAYSVGQRCSNGGYVYHCVTAGTSASSGGPTGNTSGITDGTVVWNTCYDAAGTSLFGGGTSGGLPTVSGVTITGTLATGYTLQRSNGSATGTIVAAVENPWSNGQPGQRQSLTFSLGSGGTTNEQWNLVCLYQGETILGLLPGDLTSGNFWIQAELEIEISGVQNIGGPFLNLYDNTTDLSYSDGLQAIAGSTGYTLSQYPQYLTPATEPFPVPNNGKITLRTEPYLVNSKLGNFDINFTLTFDASGAAGSSTLTLKMNQLALRRVNIG
jgi:hypothetical protein